MSNNLGYAVSAFFATGCICRSVFFCILLGFLKAFGCPIFVEFFPDPTDVPDAQGEFVEIRLELGDKPSDSLMIQFEGKEPQYMRYPQGKRLVLVHDTLYCPGGEVACGLLGGVSLPNSRESSWLLRSGSCYDSVVVPVPKAGKSYQRVMASDRWLLTEPTKGFANAPYELNVDDCGVELLNAEWENSSLLNMNLGLRGCDSSEVRFRLRDLYGTFDETDSVVVRESYSWNSLTGEAFWLEARLHSDEDPSNDTLDTLIVCAGKSPLVISEIHHCPAEPEPEWVEVYNRGSVNLPLSKFRFCDRGSSWSGEIPAGGSVIFTKDTVALRSYLGFRDVALMQVALGYLNNTAGSLSLCYGDVVLDSVRWDKNTVACPAGFSPLTHRPENTPGFQSPRNNPSVNSPFTYKLLNRVVRKNKSPLWVYVENSTSVSLVLLDSSGHSVWKETVPAGSNTWWKVPANSLLDVGVAYLVLSSGQTENMVGILVRP